MHKNISKLEEAGIDEEYVNKLELSVEGPLHGFTMYTYSKMGPYLISDLKPILFANNTQEDFIISDSPVIFYNSFFNDHNGIGTTGLQSPGLQIFFPLSPKIMLVLFDPKFYNFKKISDDIVQIDLKKDIDALNSLQLFNCVEYILFANKNQGEKIEELHSSLEHLIEADYIGLDLFTLPGTSTEFPREILNSYMKDINYNLVLSFMNFNPNARVADRARDYSLERFVKENCKIDDIFLKDRLFDTGEVEVSPGADKVVFVDGVKENLLDILNRHVKGDWGEVSREEKERNDKSIKDGSRILSAYTLSTGKKILILTDAADSRGYRTTTKILIPEEL